MAYPLCTYDYHMYHSRYISLWIFFTDYMYGFSNGKTARKVIFPWTMEKLLSMGKKYSFHGYDIPSSEIPTPPNMAGR